MRVVDVNGVGLAVAVSGEPDASPVVLLHGGGADKSTWDGTAPALARRHRVYAIDLRGFGDSDRPGDYSFELMRDDVSGLMETLGADRYAAVGHSMGGTVAWLLAQRHPERVSHLVAVDTAPPKEALVLDPGPRPEPEPPFDWDALVSVLTQLADPDPAWWTNMCAITANTLILAGGTTSHVSQQLLRDANAAVPGSRLVEIPVGHRIHRDAPDQFLAEVVPFLLP
jgi:3-oxoadipate enol-lactonase